MLDLLACEFKSGDSIKGLKYLVADIVAQPRWTTPLPINSLTDGLSPVHVFLWNFVDQSQDFKIATILARPPHGSFLANGKAWARVLRELRPDLLLTYNWGAVDWGMANALFPVCRHVHFEDGFGPDEFAGQLRRRILGRPCASYPIARRGSPRDSRYSAST